MRAYAQNGTHFMIAPTDSYWNGT